MNTCLSICVSNYRWNKNLFSKVVIGGKVLWKLTKSWKAHKAQFDVVGICLFILKQNKISLLLGLW
jgi:hypothetical protein